MQLSDAVGWKPTAVKGARMKLFKAVGGQPTAVKGLGCSYLTL